jgi:CBS-domain-containing membrane protein
MSHVVEDAIASQVKDVMTTKVSTVQLGTPYKAIAAQLHEQRVGAFPVVDKDGYVAGVVSAADLLAKAALDGSSQERLFAVRHHRELQQARGLDAADLMTSPAVTIGPRTTVRHVARVMSQRHMKRLPVVDPGGRLLGIISRSDVLSVFRYPDEDIKQAIARDVIADEFFIDPATFAVTVQNGVVTLAGPAELRLVRHGIAQQVQHMEGVVAVRERNDAASRSLAAGSRGRAVHGGHPRIR